MFISIQAALWDVLHVAKEAQEHQPSHHLSTLAHKTGVGVEVGTKVLSTRIAHH